jgi:parvulin-like peptidyl-prolyl isomerase
VLEQLIRQDLIEDRAATLSIDVKAEEIDEALERVKGQYGLSDESAFEKALAANGLTLDALKEQLRDSILANKVLAREVTINLSDDAVRTEYEKIKEKSYAVPAKAEVSEILVPFDPADPASVDAARRKIEQARSRIAAGTPFADVAREYSEGPARQQGGDLGTVAKGDLQPALDAAIFGKDVPEPVQTQDAFYLLDVRKRIPAGYRPFDEVKEEIRSKMSEEIYDKKFADYLRELRANSFVKIFDKDLASLDEDLLKSAPSS